MTYQEYYNYYSEWDNESLLYEKRTIENYIEESNNRSDSDNSATQNALAAIESILSEEP